MSNKIFIQGKQGIRQEDPLQDIKIEIYKIHREAIGQLKEELQREINLVVDRITKLEKLAGTNMFPRKICGYCSGTGKVFYGTMVEPPVGDCYICNSKGFL